MQRRSDREKLFKSTIMSNSSATVHPVMMLPHQSMWSLLHLFCHYNAVTIQQALRMFESPHAGCGGIPEFGLSQFDLAAFAQNVGVPTAVLRSGSLCEGLIGALPATRRALVERQLRYCPECAKRGYHSVLHQIRLQKTCPIHEAPLVVINEMYGFERWIWPTTRPPVLLPPGWSQTTNDHDFHDSVRKMMPPAAAKIRSFVVDQNFASQTFYPLGSELLKEPERLERLWRHCSQIAEQLRDSSNKEMRADGCSSPCDWETTVLRSYTSVHGRVRNVYKELFAFAMFDAWGLGAAPVRPPVDVDAAAKILAGYVGWRTFWEGNPSDVRRFLATDDDPRLAEVLATRFARIFGSRVGGDFPGSGWAAERFLLLLFEATFASALRLAAGREGLSGSDFSTSLASAVPLCCQLKTKTNEVFVSLGPEGALEIQFMKRD